MLVIVVPFVVIGEVHVKCNGVSGGVVLVSYILCRDWKIRVSGGNDVSVALVGYTTCSD